MLPHKATACLKKLMECPYCGADSRVLDSRRSRDEVRRRRQCHECARRFTTYEGIAAPEIRVLKREGYLQDFSRQKLLRVVLRVTKERGLSQKTCEDLVRGLEAELLDTGKPTVYSAKIAEKLLSRLSDLDAVAANRFASNYTHTDGTVHIPSLGTTPQLELPTFAENHNGALKKSL